MSRHARVSNSQKGRFFRSDAGDVRRACSAVPVLAHARLDQSCARELPGGGMESRRVFPLWIGEPLSERVAKWRHTVLMLLILFVCFQSNAASSGTGLTSSEIQKIRFHQKLDQQVTLDLWFVDEKGISIKLKQFFDQRPVILVLGYYECPMLCGLVVNGLLDALKDMEASAGRDFEVLCLSIDPSESPRLAAAKKASYLRKYLRPGAADGWHFLTGKEQAIQQLAEEVGFEYLYDVISKQYAHPSGLVVLTPKGKVARYFFGVNYVSRQLESVLKAASSNQIGSRVQEFLFLCFHYTPFKGKYGDEIMLGIRIFAFTVLAGIGGVVCWGCGMERKRHRAEMRYM